MGSLSSSPAAAPPSASVHGGGPAPPAGTPVLTPAERTLNQGVALLEAAVQADKAGAYPDALEKYNQALSTILPILNGAWTVPCGGCRMFKPLPSFAHLGT